MNSILEFIIQYSTYLPLAVFLVLLPAGFNLPISEDAIIILSATLVHQNKNILFPTYIGLYFGILISDIISYFLGKFIAKGFLQFKFLKKKLTPQRIEWISTRLSNHGFKTFVTCRFIPFGIRNILFMGSGFVGLPFLKFLCFDSIAALISSSSLFFLVYFIGNLGKNIFSALGIILFIILIITLTVLIIKRKKSKSKKD